MTSLIGASSIIFWSSKVLGADGGCGLKAVNPIPTSPILVNGCPRGKIWALRGIGQGTSLSHFLFPIVADSFSHFVNIWRNKDLIEGFIVGQDSIHISHVQYADDTLFLFFFLQRREMFLQKIGCCCFTFSRRLLTYQLICKSLPWLGSIWKTL